MINVVDIQSGNVRTWAKLLERLLIPYKLVKNPKEIDSKIILLPGVGSAGYFMDKMKSKGSVSYTHLTLPTKRIV